MQNHSTKIWTILPLTLLWTSAMPARAWEIMPWGGITLGDSLDASGESQGTLRIKDAATYGLAVGTPFDDGHIEVLWSHSKTEVTGQSTTRPGTHSLLDLTMDRVLFNAMYYVVQEGQVRPFVSCGLGATLFSPGSDYSSATRFAGAIGGGVKFDMTSLLAIRIDGRWAPTVLSSSSQLFCASGAQGGTCVAVASGEMLNQWEFGAGLALKFGEGE